VANFRQYEPAERELLEALAHTIEEEPGSADISKCPSPAELRQLAKGACNSPARRAELLVHLADCNHCIQILKRIREGRVFRQRAMVIAILVVVAATIWTWSQRRSGENRDVVATIDLRLVTPTRGDEKPGTLQPAKVRRHTAQLRVMLPLGSDGTYEVGILPGGSNQPLLARASGSTQIEDHTVVLHLPVDLSTVTPGNYSLALKKSGGEWEYYSLTVE